MLSRFAWPLSISLPPAPGGKQPTWPPPVSAQGMEVTAAGPGWGREGVFPWSAPICFLLASFEELLPPLLRCPLGCEDTRRLISCYNNTHQLPLHLARLFIPSQIMDLPAVTSLPLASELGLSNYYYYCQSCYCYCWFGAAIY